MGQLRAYGSCREGKKFIVEGFQFAEHDTGLEFSFRVHAVTKSHSVLQRDTQYNVQNSLSVKIESGDIGAVVSSLASYPGDPRFVYRVW